MTPESGFHIVAQPERNFQRGCLERLLVQGGTFLTAGGRLAVCRVGLLTENRGKELWREEKQERMQLNLGSDVKIDIDKRQRGRVCKALLVPRKATSVKVGLTTEN